jgi:hypothetical protein
LFKHVNKKVTGIPKEENKKTVQAGKEHVGSCVLENTDCWTESYWVYSKVRQNSSHAKKNWCGISTPSLKTGIEIR